MFERFTQNTRTTVTNAVDTAATEGADKVGPHHLLLTLSANTGSTGARIMSRYGITAEELGAHHEPGPAGLTRKEIEALNSVGVDTAAMFRRIEDDFGPEALTPTAPRTPRKRGRLGSPFAPRAKKVLELSLREATATGHSVISTAHLLLALLRQGLAEPAAGVFADHGLTYDEARRHTITELDAAA